MKTTISFGAILLLCSVVHANEALDVLEGRKSAAEVSLPATSAGGGSPESLAYPETAWPASPLDPVWSRAVLFDDPENPWIQQVAITGFFEWQAAVGEAEVDQVDATPAKDVELDGSRTRRARLGARLRAFRNTDIEASAEFAGDSNYSGIERLRGRTEVLPNASVTYGKFRPRFTAEYSIEDAYFPYPERSMLTNMIAPHSTLGVQFDYQWRDWEFGAGWFSGDYSADFPGFDGDGFLTFNIARTFVEKSGDSSMRTRWHFDFIENLDAGHSSAIPRYNVAGRMAANGDQLVARNPEFRHMLSTGFQLDQDRFSFLGDFMLAKGDTTVWGMMLGPSYWLCPGYVNLVGRYHYAGTDDAGALVATMGASGDPFFDSSPFFIGDEYHSFYLGANVQLYQNKLVLMSGVEQVLLDDETGGSFNTEALIWHAGAKASF